MRPIFSKKWQVLLLTAVCIAGLVACQKFMPSPAAGDSMLDGPVDGLTSAEKIQFLKGDVAFNDDVFTRETGLGPLFVATSCGSCHAGDGKGHPFTTLVRFGQSDTLNGNRFLHMGGPQLQQRALPGFQPEQVPAGAVHSGFTPPANTGLGFIDAIPDAAILALADPNDLDGDGISGRANWISPPHYTICAAKQYHHKRKIHRQVREKRRHLRPVTANSQCLQPGHGYHFLL
jgi:hypothetical protein